MSIKEFSSLENIAIPLECSVNALSAIHTAMAEGPVGPECFVPALLAIYDYQDQLVKRLRQIIGDEAPTKGEEIKK